MIKKIILSAIFFAVYGAFSLALHTVDTLALGIIAGDQFYNSNSASIATSFVFFLIGFLQGFMPIMLILALIVLWAEVVMEWLGKLIFPALLLMFVATHSDHALAYADVADKTEAYTILPNQSAFWVPDVGANKDDQKQFESESYYAERKIAAKRFVIPHTKLGGSGGFLGWDFYVPAGRLYIVDRTPYSREWVSSTNRGTSNKDEGIHCQSKDGLNITAGVSIGTSVTEDNAAKFLYNFGVTPPKGLPTDPQVIFTSVYYGRSVQEVMDDVGRKKVQTLVCNEIGKRTFDEANNDMILMMSAVEKTTKEYFGAVGITLNFIGWADTFSFDPDVQFALNEKYKAEKLAAAIPILQQIAQLRVQAGLGKGLEEHGLPIVVTPGMLEALEHLAVGAPK